MMSSSLSTDIIFFLVMLHKWEHSKLISFMKQMCDCVPILSNKCFISANCYIRHSVCTSMIYIRRLLLITVQTFDQSINHHTPKESANQCVLFSPIQLNDAGNISFQSQQFPELALYNAFICSIIPSKSFSYLWLHHNQRPPVDNNLKIFWFCRVSYLQCCSLTWVA